VVRVHPADIEACSDWLFQLGATAIEDRVTAAEPSLIAGFVSDEAALAARSVLIERWPCRLEDTGDEASWRDEWMKWVEPIEVAGYVVHAPWHDPTSWRSGAPDISIDPGRAFGSGHHATTRLAMAALADVVGPSSRVLDVGCGTGILSIAAAKMGALSVLGIDLDYDILEVASANIETNGVASRVSVLTDPLASLHDSFDVVVANIVIGDLEPLMPDLVGQAEAYVIVSGFLDDQFERLLSQVAIDVVDRTNLDGWGCALLAPLP